MVIVEIEVPEVGINCPDKNIICCMTVLNVCDQQVCLGPAQGTDYTAVPDVQQPEFRTIFSKILNRSLKNDLITILRLKSVSCVNSCIYFRSRHGRVQNLCFSKR